MLSPEYEPAAAARIGIIDIGSNSIRLVVFDGLRRTPIPVFNERVLCGLGRGIQETGRLNPDGVAQAHENLARFVSLAGSMGVSELDAVATAAVRDAEDGAAFVADVERRYRIRVDILSGEEEARFSALGILSGIPEAHGVMGDLGGGSLELVAVNQGALGHSVTLPLGSLRLLQATGGRHRDLDKTIDKSLAGVSWLKDGRGAEFYAVGGAWRALAHLHMSQTAYPLRVIDHYTVPRREMEGLLSVLMLQSPQSLGAVRGVAAQRLETLPVAARMMRRLLRRMRPRRVVFSAQGLREGILYSRLPPAVQAEDPLISACRDMATGLSRFDVLGEELLAWTAPLFADEDDANRRLRLAVCLLADVGWSEHPDYRAEHAFYKAYRLPGVGIDHAGRAFLALALEARYGGGVHHSVRTSARGLLDEEAARRATILGLALRLALTVSGGSSDVLRHAALQLEDGGVSLSLSDKGREFAGTAVRNRLNALARELQLRPELVLADAPARRRG